jgi:hypothetical protein
MMIIVVFSFDIGLTIEAALYSDVLLIAVLHIFTIPTLCFLVYYDLVQQSKGISICFVCGKNIEEGQEKAHIEKFVDGTPKRVVVHLACMSEEEKKDLVKNSLVANEISDSD